MSVRRFLLIFVFCFLYVVTNAIPLGGTGLGDYFPEKLSISGNVTILNGGLSVSQTVTANLFVGNGSGLTHLPAVSTANLALTSNISVSMDAQGLMGAISVATGNTIMSITTAGNVGIGTKNPLSNLDVVGSFRFRDAENPSKGFRYRFGGATDVEGGGSDIYFSVWDNGDFTGVQRNKMLMEKGTNVLQLIHETQFRDNPQGNKYAAIYGDNGNAFFQGTVGIGTAAPSTKLDVVGIVSASAVQVNGTITANRLSSRLARRVVSIVSSATPAINSDATDLFIISALATNITSMTSGLTGTPVDGDLLEIRILDDGTARTITWGSSFASTTITLPATTIISTTLRILLEWNAATSKWECIAVT